MDVWFEGLSCTSHLSRRRLLDEVSGRFLSGELTAILGHSGAGKTTLLNAISGYRRIRVSGEMSPLAGHSSCYIGQEDLLAPMVSAGELMEFSAQVKLPGTTTKQRAAVVEELLSSLGLEDCYDTRTESLSGGQRRRLSIALELVNNPIVLFLDEPTSGLDTVSTVQLVKLLSRLSRGGRTIVCTIHQPSASLLELFDRVYFLALGKCVYQGGPGPHLIHYLAAHDLVCPIHYNPADFVIEVTEDRVNIKALCSASKNGKISWYLDGDRGSSQNPPPVAEGLKQRLAEDFILQDSRPRPSFLLQFTAIFSKLLLQANRNKIGLYIQLFHHIGCSLLIGSMFYNSTNDGQDPFGQIKFYMVLIVFYTYTHAIISILQYPHEVKLVKRDHFNKWYSLPPYYFAFTAVKACYMIPLLLMFVTIAYSLSGLPWEFQRFLLFFGVGILTSSISEALGLVIGTLFSITNGSIIGPLALTPIFGFAIYGLDFSRAIHPLFGLLLRTSFMRAARTGMFLVGFGIGREKLDCPMDTSHCVFNDPRVFLYYLNLEDVTIWHTMCDLFLNLCFYRFALYLALKWRLRT